MLPITYGDNAISALQNGAYQSASITIAAPSAPNTSLYTFTNADIVQGSLTVSKSGVSDTVTRLGAIVSDEMGVTLRITRAIALNLPDKLISLTVSWPYDTENPGYQEYLWVFNGIVTDVIKRSEDVYFIRALDPMIAFDQPYRATELLDPDDPNHPPITYPLTVEALVWAIVWNKGYPYFDRNGIVTNNYELNTWASVTDIPEDQGYTYRQVLQMCAEIMGVNMRISPSTFPVSLEYWKWHTIPSQYPDVYDEPYCITQSNAYRIALGLKDWNGPLFRVVTSGNVVTASVSNSNYTGLVEMRGNYIYDGIYARDDVVTIGGVQKIAADEIENNLWGRIRDDWYYLKKTGTCRTTPMWYLEPGDVVGVMTGASGDLINVTSVTFKLNGATEINSVPTAEYTETQETTVGALSKQQQQAVEAQIANVCYYPGDEYSGTSYGYGYVTGSKQTLNVTIPLPKVIHPNVKGLEITNLKIQLRSPAGGFIESDGYDALSLLNGYTIFGNCVNVRMKKTGTDTWYSTNNIPVCGGIVTTIKFT